MFLKYFIELLKRYNKGFKREIFSLFFMAVLSGFMELIGIAMIFPVMFILTSADTKEGKILLDFFVKFFPNMPEIKIAIFLSFFMIFVFILKNIFMIFFLKKQNFFVKKWSDYANSKIVEKLLFAPYLAVKNLSYGDKIFLLSAGAREVSLSFILRVVVLLANGVVTLSILALLFYKFTVPAFLSTLFILCFTAIENSFFKKRAKALGQKGLELSCKFGENVNFIISSNKEIIISNKRQFFADKLNQDFYSISDNFSKEVFYGNCPLYVTEIGVIISFLIMIATISLMTDVSKASMVSSVAVIALMVLRLVPQLNKVLISMYMINIAKPKVAWFLEKLDKISEFEFDFQNQADPVDFKENIELKNVTFLHKNTGKGVFNINLKIKKGEFIGIIGLSGSGKTTLADVISGVFSPNSGEILVDGVKITNKNIASLQKKISFLPQESSFLDDTVLKNVAWGLSDDEIDEEKARKALLQAEIDVDINSKTEFSKGQKNRIALARAYYKPFDILLLDEATSSLDVEIENQVTSNILKLKGEKTIIAIAHRLNTLKNCDRIIYLNEGKIVDIGNFEELRRRNVKIDEMLKISSFD